MVNSKIFQRLLGFTLLLLVLRVWYSESPAYLFLVWNLFLAWLPWYFMSKFTQLKHRKQQLVLLCLVLLFLPNAPYLITDLFHLGKQRQAPLWLDTLLLSSFAILGCLLFVQTLVLFFAAIHHTLNFGKYLAPIKVCIMLLNGYGIYLGRYLRFNSWNIITQPLRLVKAIADSFEYGSQLKETLAITISFAAFLLLIYEMVAENNTHETISEK